MISGRTWIVLAAAALAGGAADAVVITRSFSIQATGFPAGSAYATVAGMFSVTFDNGASIANGTSSGLSVSGYTLPNAPTDYAYSAAGDQLVIGFNTSVPAAGATDCSLLASQSCLKIRDISTVPTGISLRYNIDGVRTGALVVTPLAVGGVPEPASWVMMVAGFGAVGTALRSRKRASARPARGAPRPAAIARQA